MPQGSNLDLIQLVAVLWYLGINKKGINTFLWKGVYINQFWKNVYYTILNAIKYMNYTEQHSTILCDCEN